MQWIEIITFRSARPAAVYRNGLKTLIPEADPEAGLEKVEIYRRQDLGTDVRIHMIWNGFGQIRKSPTGWYLSERLRGFGLVNHQIWIKEDLK